MNSNNQLLTTDFYSLINGENLPEKWRSFNSYLNRLSLISNNQQDLIVLINSITPRNSTEEAFKIDIMMKFKLYHHLIKELKRNNPMVIRKLLKNSTVFSEIFSGVNPQEFIEDIFPYLSYPGKLKILHGIYKNVHDEVYLEKLYLIVEKEYGSRLAGNLLAGCNIDLIKSKLSKHPVRFSDKQLITIFKKDTHFLLYYLQFLKEKGIVLSYFTYRKALKEFARIYPELFWIIDAEYTTNVIFGRRLTPLMFKYRSRMWKEDRDILSHFRKINRLYKSAIKSGELKEFLASLFPSNVADFTQTYYNQHMERFINRIPSCQRSQILNEIFKEKYGDSVEYCWGCFQILPVPFKEEITEDDFIIFHHPYKRIPLIKNKHPFPANLKCEPCRIYTINYKNQTLLIETLEDIITKHKDDIPAINLFLNYLLRLPNVTKLDESCWRRIAEMNKLLELSDSSYNNEIFYSTLFDYLIRNAKPLYEYCRKRLQELLDRYNYVAIYIFRLFILPKYERIYLIEMGKEIHSFKSHKNYQAICISYLMLVVDFNTINKNKLNPIDLNNYTLLFDQIKTTNCYGSQSIITYGLRYYQSDEIWHNLFWRQVKVFRNNVTLSKYVRKWPQRVVENFHKVLDDLALYRIELFVKQAKRLLDEKSLDELKKHTLNMLNCGEYEKVHLAIIILSYIAPKSLLTLIYPLITSKGNKDISKGEFILKKLAIKNLHRLGNFKEIFDILLGYCNNQNYSRYITIPLWNIACNSPEIYLKEELIKFADGPASVRKLILILSKFLFKSDDFAKFHQIVKEKE